MLKELIPYFLIQKIFPGIWGAKLEKKIPGSDKEK